MANEYKGYALIYGGNGALGSGCTSIFKSAGWWVASVDLWRDSLVKTPKEDKCEASSHVILKDDKPSEEYHNQLINEDLDVNILVHYEKSVTEQKNDIFNQLTKVLNGKKLDAIICVAGGYSLGNAHENLIEDIETMWKRNVIPAIISAAIATQFLATNGVLCLSGASAALNPTPNAIGYGLAKAAIHQLTKSLAAPESGLHPDSLCVALLPVTIDTVVNRKSMPEGNISEWTPTKYIAELLLRWCNQDARPKNGSLVKLTTVNFNTDVTYI